VQWTGATSATAKPLVTPGRGGATRHLRPLNPPAPRHRRQRPDTPGKTDADCLGFSRKPRPVLSPHARLDDRTTAAPNRIREGPLTRLAIAEALAMAQLRRVARQDRCGSVCKREHRDGDTAGPRHRRTGWVFWPRHEVARPGLQLPCPAAHLRHRSGDGRQHRYGGRRGDRQRLSPHSVDRRRDHQPVRLGGQEPVDQHRAHWCWQHIPPDDPPGRELLRRRAAGTEPDHRPGGGSTGYTTIAAGLTAADFLCYDISTDTFGTANPTLPAIPCCSA
jgi:hypothetical protein